MLRILSPVALLLAEKHQRLCRVDAAAPITPFDSFIDATAGGSTLHDAPGETRTPAD
jgi:hypothetical protein